MTTSLHYCTHTCTAGVYSWYVTGRYSSHSCNYIFVFVLLHYIYNHMALGLVSPFPLCQDDQGQKCGNVEHRQVGKQGSNLSE